MHLGSTMKSLAVGLAMLVAGITSPPGQGRAGEALAIHHAPAKEAANDSPYLVGFTFQGEYSFSNPMPEEQLRIFNDGAFDGWALIYVWNYAPEPGPPVKELADTLAWLKARLEPGKHIWPAISLSRIIQPAGNYLPERTRFHEIPGIDLENEAGVRATFEAEWRNACLIARDLGSPGIFFDPEWYGNSAVRFPEELAKMRDEKVETTRAKCRALGARLVDITEKTYPGCHIFTMYTGLYERPEHWTSIAHIHLGMLQRQKELRSRQKLVDGGELGLGYLATSFATFQERIYNRWLETRDLLLRYPNYELGGVLAPYMDRSERSPWAADHRIGTEQTAKDFAPHFRELFRNYHYTWIYGTHTGETTGFNPWGRQHSAVMSGVFERAMRISHVSPPDLRRLPDRKAPEGDRAWEADQLARGPRKVLVDWSAPGQTHILPKYYRGQGAVPETTTISPGPFPADGEQWNAGIEFDKSQLDKEQFRWPGPGVSATGLTTADLGAYDAAWTKVYNPGKKPIGIQFAVFLPGNQTVVANSYDGYAVGSNISPGESRILFCGNLKGPIEAVSLSTRGSQPDESMTIYTGPVYLGKSTKHP